MVSLFLKENSDESSSSSESEAESEHKSKKRSRDGEDDSELIGSIVKAFHTGNNNDRDRMAMLWQTGDRKQFKAAIDETVKRNMLQYHVVMLDEKGGNLDPLLQSIIDGTGKTFFLSREEAVERAKELQDMVKAHTVLTFRIDEIRPNGV